MSRSSAYTRLVRPGLFRLSSPDPERAHHTAMRALAAASASPAALAVLRRVAIVDDPRLRRTLFGLDFPNPVGLAAGFDKDARALPALAALGFGHIEAGTVTRLPQPGNPRPRIARFPNHDALINRMGFPNDGAVAVARRLGELPRPLHVPLGISIGKTKSASYEEAIDDYRASLCRLAPHADYIAVNVSSPNTPGLRALQGRQEIDALLTSLLADLTGLVEPGHTRTPLLVKVAPDLTPEALDDLLTVCLARGIDGIIAVNTTLDRTALPVQTTEAGGLSGRPLHRRALAVVRQIYARTEGRLPIIGVGGIFTAADAARMLAAGASLVQLYTALIYEGPFVARRINQGLLRLMERDGVGSVADLSPGRSALTPGPSPESGRGVPSATGVGNANVDRHNGLG